MNKETVKYRCGRCKASHVFTIEPPKNGNYGKKGCPYCKLSGASGWMTFVEIVK